MKYARMVASHTSRLLRRNMVTWICGGGIVGVVTYLVVVTLSSFSKYPTIGELTLASFFPYMSMMLLSVVQVVALVFLVKPATGGEERLDGMEVIHTRPQGNAAYTWGMAWGYARVFGGVDVIVVLLTMGVHLFASNYAPFNGWLYVFYFVTLVVPTYLFCYGLCLVVQTVVRRCVVGLTLLLMFWIVALVWMGTAWQGTLDPTGRTLPDIFSDSVGHPGLGNYLLQRVGWALAGVGLIQWAMMGFRRLPNEPGRRWQAKVAAVVLCAGGVACVAGYGLQWLERAEKREAYRETAEKYAGMPRVTLVAESLDYRQEGRRMAATAEVEVENRTGKRMEEWALWLNPGLEVTKVEGDGGEETFERENQVVVVKRGMEAGEAVRLRIAYEGGIDEDVCYLEVDEHLYFAALRDSMDLLSGYGRRSAYLGKRYTLLTPEALWYPTATPPLNLEHPYLTERDFTQFALRVKRREGQTVISQGETREEGEAVIFRNDRLLTGLSLCMGDYERHRTVVDSVACELYLFRRNYAYFDSLCRYFPTTVEHLKKSAERAMGKAYPYERFRLVETPVSLVSYYRDATGGYEDAQPEIMFAPEKLMGFSTVDKGWETGVLSINLANDLEYMLWGYRILAQRGLKNPLYKENLAAILFTGKRVSRISPLFHEHVECLQSERYPAINQVARLIMQGFTLFASNSWGIGERPKAHARMYLNGHSLQEGVMDKEVPLEVQKDLLNLKTEELVKYLVHRGIKQDTLRRFVRGYMNRHPFKTSNFEDFDKAFERHFGLSLSGILPGWYARKELPKYQVKDLNIVAVSQPKEGIPLDENEGSARSYGSGIRKPCLLTFTIYNDSDADGICSVDYPAVLDESTTEDKSLFYYLKGRTGRSVAMYLPDGNGSVAMNLGLCQNMPHELYLMTEYGQEVRTYQVHDSAVGIEALMPEANVTVLDNEDEGFSIEQEGKRLARWQARRQQEKQQVPYDNLLEFCTLDDMWRTVLDYGAYGEVNRSLVTRLAGEGYTRVTWETELKEEGWYEVLVFVPTFNSMQMASDFMGIISNEWGARQYEVAFEEEEAHTVEAPTMEKGWVSLGIFHGNTGKSRVSLSDKGVVGRQQIIGDAVKWVFLGQENPQKPRSENDRVSRGRTKIHAW